MLALLGSGFVASADNLDIIGVRLLRQVDGTLLGANVYVAQPEAATPNVSPPDFEVAPVSVGQPESLFSYNSSLGVATNYPNSVGAASGHAADVGNHFYGINEGVAPQVAHADNFEATYFYENIILPLTPSISAKVVNQSFIFNDLVASTVEQSYDNYSALHGTLFISGVGNGDVPVSAPGTCFNGIGVGVTDGNSSVGPTSDGRSKPDLVAPGQVTSYSTPYVSGSAAVLWQAASRGDGGTNLTAATDARTLKALLLNGAIKPAGWTNSPATPLDARHGAGVVNVFNSWQQLQGGQHSYIESTSVTHDGPHPPGANAANAPVRAGWDRNTISTIPLQDMVNHYYFDLPVTSGPAFTLTATLVWQRQQGQTAINDLNLFLYDIATSNLVMCSTSEVDNVEHLYLPTVPAGWYDLQVLKRGITTQVSPDEIYALAFEFFQMPLQLNPSAEGITLSWPIAPAGFQLMSTTNLASPVNWQEVSATPVVSNEQNVVTLMAGANAQFFRLQRP